MYSEIVRYDISAAELRDLQPNGIILSGGSASVYDKGQRLRRKRTKADYDSEVLGLASLAAHSIRDADAILSFLKQ